MSHSMLSVLAGVMKEINSYVHGLNTRTNDPDMVLFPVSQGVETLAIISAMHVPSVLIQVRDVAFNVTF